jgi:hypothetical protein
LPHFGVDPYYNRISADLRISPFRLEPWFGSDHRAALNRLPPEVPTKENAMLTLDLPVEPYWLDLPRGVRVEIRPVTTAVMAATQAGSARRLGALRAAEADLDPDMARGLAFAFLVKALARHAVTAWEGVGDAAGKPLPLSPGAVERLMDMDEMAAAFWDRATGPVATVALEGNG